MARIKTDSITIDATLADKAIARHAPKVKTPKTIKNDGEYLAVVTQLKQIKGHQNALEEDREKIIKPIRAGLDALYEKFRDAADTLDTIERQLKDRCEAFAEKKQTKAIASAEKKAAKAPTKELARATIEQAENQEHVPKVNGVSYRTVWDFTIDDAAKVPQTAHGIEIRPIKEANIRKIVKLHKSGTKIKGVTAYAKKQSTVRA